MNYSSTNTQNLSGIITLTDGGGTTISNGEIDCTRLFVDGVQIFSDATANVAILQMKLNDVNYDIVSDTTSISGNVSLYKVTASTPLTTDNSTNLATTAYVKSNLSNYLSTSAAASTYATISSLSSYLTSAIAATTYATISSLSSYLTTSAAASTYATISSLSSYLTTSAAASTYATISSLSSYALTSSLSSYLTISAAASTYATISSLSSYLTSATAATTYATISSLSSYLTTSTASSTYATISSLSSYLTTSAAATTYATISSLSSYALTSSLSSYLTTSAAASTYMTISSLSGYLTATTAASTYATISSLSSYLTTTAAASTYLTSTTAASTYATISSLSSYLTTTTAASTYATISSLSSYLTTSAASSTYLTQANALSTYYKSGSTTSFVSSTFSSGISFYDGVPANTTNTFNEYLRGKKYFNDPYSGSQYGYLTSDSWTGSGVAGQLFFNNGAFNSLIVNGSITLPSNCIPSAALGSNVALIDTSKTWTATQTFNNISVNTVSANNLLALTSIVLPNHSIADSALSTNVPLLSNTTNIFSNNVELGGILYLDDVSPNPPSLISGTIQSQLYYGLQTSDINANTHSVAYGSTLPTFTNKCIGYSFCNSLATAISPPTNGTTYSIASFSLTAGVWLLYVHVVFSNSSGTSVNFNTVQLGVSTSTYGFVSFSNTLSGCKFIQTPFTNNTNYITNAFVYPVEFSQILTVPSTTTTFYGLVTPYFSAGSLSINTTSCVTGTRIA